MTTFVLIHSPLVGPLTWTLVADELRERDVGVGAIAPVLPDSREVDPPYWKAHAEAVAEAARKAEQHTILVGHSGAGMLLPAIRQAIGRPVVGYLFVDAGLPSNGKSRLDLFESKEGADQFRQAAQDGLLPIWTAEELRDHIPDDDLRRRYVAELRPLPLAVYEEPIPVFAGWPDVPCGYLLFSPVYESAAAHARDQGWPYARIEARHFHMLVDAPTVAKALIELAKQMGAL
jgi:hypothetical protein